MIWKAHSTWACFQLISVMFAFGGLVGLHNLSAMVSATSGGIFLRRTLIHANASRFLACVNRVWLQAVRAVIRELRRKLLSSSFHVNCLGHSPSDDMAEQRLRRKLNRQFGEGESISDLTVWWYNTELHLLDTLSKQPMSFQDLLFRCYSFSVYKGYDFEIFRGLYCHRNDSNLDEPLAADSLFCFSRFDSKRD